MTGPASRGPAESGQGSEEPGSTLWRLQVPELDWETAQVDPKKTIQMGSFQINPDGHQSVVEVTYAHTEAHLTEQLEEVCDQMKEHGDQTDPPTYRKNYDCLGGRNGESNELDLQAIWTDSDVRGTPKFACENIVEEQENELTEFSSQEANSMNNKFCRRRTDL